MGNRDGWDCHGMVWFISELNRKFGQYAAAHNDFYIHDIHYLAASYGLDAWHDNSYWYLYKYAMTLDAIPEFAYSLTRIIRSIYGKNKKVLALDLDNTLWGGVIGDDGQEGISIGQETAEAEAYTEVQEYCKAQKQLGVLLTICSKNEPENARLGLSHPDSVLHEDDFVAIKANWEPKDRNLVQTAADSPCCRKASSLWTTTPQNGKSFPPRSPRLPCRNFRILRTAFGCWITRATLKPPRFPQQMPAAAKCTVPMPSVPRCSRPMPTTQTICWGWICTQTFGILMR